MKNIEVDKIVDPWVDCKLGRKAEAIKLERLAESICEERIEGKKSGTYTINLDARWGEGKTTFIKNWIESLKENHIVVYINVWKTDYVDDPLLAFCVELDSAVDNFRDVEKGSTKSQRNRKVIKFAKTCAPLLLKGAIKKITGIATEEYLDAFDNVDVSDLAEGLSGKLIELFEAQSLAISLIEKQLSELVDKVQKSKNFRLPIYIFVDELDRCKPSYAIQVLERIKHIFDVTGIQFVVATDTEQLEHTIKSVYGNGFDARRYLRRFFDLQYHFPSIETRDYAQFLLSSENAPWQKNLFIPEIKGNGTLVEFFYDMSLVFNWSMRDQGQICEKLAVLARLEFDSENKLHVVPALFYLGLKELLDEKKYFEVCSVSSTNEVFNRLKIHFPGVTMHSSKIYGTSVQSAQGAAPGYVSIISIIDFYLKASALSDVELGHKSQQMVSTGCEFSIYMSLHDQRLKRAKFNQIFPVDYPKLIASIGSFKEIKLLASL